MSRKQSNYKRSSLGQLIRGLHKHSPKTMAEEQKTSIKNKRQVVLSYNWKGHATFRPV